MEIETGYNLGQRLNWMVVQGMNVANLSCQLKVFGARALQHLANVAMRTLGLYGQLDEKSGWARLRGRIEHMYLASPGWSIGGGTSEVSKNFIASRLETPQAPVKTGL
jgi:alkylation response protein AidB-like acyl-CoA dehydrogenase